MSCIYSTDEVHASTVCRKKVNTTDGEMIKINRAGAVSGYLKGIENIDRFLLTFQIRIILTYVCIYSYSINSLMKFYRRKA